jgi:hypothetical protein
MVVQFQKPDVEFSELVLDIGKTGKSADLHMKQYLCQCKPLSLVYVSLPIHGHSR